jgi:hypothetical protein
MGKCELGLSKAQYFDKLVMDESLGLFHNNRHLFSFCGETFATEERLYDY